MERRHGEAEGGQKKSSLTFGEGDFLLTATSFTAARSQAPRTLPVDLEEALNYRARMSTAELQAIVAENARSINALRASQKETDRQIKELGTQIGGLGRKFGSFAEGLSYASIEKILREDFELNEFVTPAARMRKEGREEEYDVLAYSNGSIDKGMIVEIKSKLRQEDIDQMKRKMEEVFYWLPEHKNTAFYGMVAYVSGPSDLKKQIIENGWYMARVGDEIFEMETPMGFQPRGYTA